MNTSHDLPEVTNRMGRVALVAWVGFLAACLLEVLVFSAVDPGEVHWSGHLPQPTRQGVYTAAFFCFWLISAVSGSLVLWLAKIPAQLNDTAAG
ncbi:MAG: hypothetical protein V4454_07335 [Pseudomonadota bacterium]